MRENKALSLVSCVTNGVTYEWEITALPADGSLSAMGDLKFVCNRGGTRQNVAFIDDDQVYNYKMLNFTGVHRCVADKALDVEATTGLIVIATGNYCSLLGKEVKQGQKENITVDEALPTIELCTKRRDKRVFGVVSAPDQVREDKETKKKSRLFRTGRFVSCVERDTDRVEVNSLGEGGVWVCSRGGNLENGDYITTSDLAGYGERQEEPYVCGWTLGKITCDVDWSRKDLDKDFQTRELDGALCAFVGCVYVL